MLKFCGKKVDANIENIVGAYLFFEQSNFSGYREESLWGGGNGRKGTASYSFICWFLMIGLSFFAGVVDWLKVLLSIFGLMYRTHFMIFLFFHLFFYC